MNDPHGAQAVLQAGVPLGQARVAVIMLHGRGAGAGDMIGLAGELGVAGAAYLAPQAAGHTWYPQRFMAPIAQNEPALGSALARIRMLIAKAGEAGVDPARVVLLGFSQGACLAAEYAARHAQRYGGIVALSGGLIGPPGTPRAYPGSFEGTPAFFGCSDIDPHIPLARVTESADVFRRMGAAVDERIYAGMGHTVNADEMATIRTTLEFVQVR